MAAALARVLLSACCLLFAPAAGAQPGAAPAPDAETSRAASGKVVMYATDWCPYCARARAYFRKRGIDYVEHDIEKSAAAREEYRRLGGRGVPLILVGDQRVAGFNEERFEALYAGSRR